MASPEPTKSAVVSLTVRDPSRAVSTDSGSKETGESLDVAPEADPALPPLDGPEGWLIVFAALFVSFQSIGQRDSFGVLQRFFANDKTFDTTNLVVSLISAVCASIWSVAGPLSVAVTKRIGYRHTMVLGGLLICVGDVLGSLSTQVWHLHLTLGAIVGIGIGLCYYPISVLPVQWFRRRKGLAQGVMQCGSGLGGFAISNWTQRMIDSPGLGWRWALRINGFIAFGVVLLASRFIRYRVARESPVSLPPTQSKKHLVPTTHTPPPPARPRSLLSLLVRQVDFWMLYMQGVFCCFAFYIPFLFFPTSAVNVGLTPSQGAFVLSMVNIGSAVGRLSMGVLSDGLGLLNVFILSMLLLLLAVIPLWATATSLSSMIAAAFIYGLGTGGYVTLEPLAVAVMLGYDDFGAKLGWVFTGFLPGTMVGGPIGGALVDAHTTFDPVTGVKAIDIWPLCIYSFACQLLSAAFIVVMRFRLKPRRLKG
ncbi:MFS general substrate transporter [Gonapodya prolifera JEL478]|uniref:MFS general substrate transporter n=1 Tax=Gonapodya prolifera (strain JEL478) TaxID=1344416 RepID=A0A139A6E5_GONPJ|nr:MFS general substrate transporter [Gonapodya prolifera JEL478]|eukprot:KXS12331.1 MFS general substrate transporter [Gonapodya prolifera JEL478]